MVCAIKKRQKEIYDAQTGSAQPHIYPQHIATMPISTLNFDDIHNYTVTVTPIFEMIGHNKDENIDWLQLVTLFYLNLCLENLTFLISTFKQLNYCL